MKYVKKNLAILLCVCMICQTGFVSYAAMHMINIVQNATDYKKEVATLSNYLPTENKENEDENWTEQDEELYDDRTTPSNTSWIYVIESWKWKDERGYLQEGVLMIPDLNQKIAISKDEVISFLPKEIIALVENQEGIMEEMTIPIEDWECDTFEEEAWKGEYLFTASLSKKYWMSKNADALVCEVLLGNMDSAWVQNTFDLADGLYKEVWGTETLDQLAYLDVVCFGDCTIKTKEKVVIGSLTVNGDLEIDAGSKEITINQVKWLNGTVTMKGKVTLTGPIDTIGQECEMIFESNCDVQIAEFIGLANMSCKSSSKVEMEQAYITNLDIFGNAYVTGGAGNITIVQVNWSSGNLELNGNVIFEGDVNVCEGGGHGEFILKDQCNVVINGDLNMILSTEGQRVNLDSQKGSKLTVYGDVRGNKFGGGWAGYWYANIHMNGEITIWGDFFNDAKEVFMEEESAYVTIYGDYTQQMGPGWLGIMMGEDSLLTAGTLEVKGNYLYDSMGTSNFLQGTHTIILSGDEKQTVYGLLKNVIVRNTSDEGVFFQSFVDTGAYYGGTYHTKIYGTLCVEEDSVISGSSTENMLLNKVTMLEITAAPHKMQYLPGETVSGKGMELQVTYVNGERRPTYGGWTIKAETNAGFGKVPIEVEFGGMTIPFEVITEEEGALREGNIITYNHHKYRLFAEYLTWDEAKKRCGELGGYPVTITSEEEAGMVLELVNKYSGLSGKEVIDEIWLGLTDEQEAWEWKWITGESYGYYNWDPVGCNVGGGKSNAVMSRAGYWKNTYGGFAYPYICEWDGEKPKPPSTAGNVYSFECFYPQNVKVEYPVDGVIFRKEDKKLPGIPSDSDKKAQYKSELLSWAKEFGYEELFTEPYLDMLVDGDLSHSILGVFPTENGLYKKEDGNPSVTEYMRDIIFLSTLHNSTVDWNKSYVDKFDPNSYSAGALKTKEQVIVGKMKEIRDRAFKITDKYIGYTNEINRDPFNGIMNTSFSAVESLNQLNSFNKVMEINSSIRDDITQIEKIYQVVEENGTEIPVTIQSIKGYLGKGKKYLAYGNDLISLYQKTQEKEPSMADFLESVSTLINFAPSGKGMVGKLLTPLKSSIQDTLKMAADASIVGPFFIHMYLSQDENYVNKYIDIKKDGSTSANSMALAADSEWKQLPGRKTMRSIVQMTADVLEGSGFPTYLNHQDSEQLIYCVSIINAAEKFDSKAVREQFIRHLAQIIEREKDSSGQGTGKYRVEVMCPVDVQVYQGGVCIGSIVNGEMDNQADDTIRMNVYGENLDKKTIEFLDFDDFCIELQATDNGSMDLFVRQYDASGIHQKTVGFQEVPLTAGKGMQLDLELADTFPDYLELQMTDGERGLTPTLFLTGGEVSQQPETIELLDDLILMECGGSYRIPRVIQPVTSDEGYIEWKTSDASCVTVDTVGNIMAKASGTAIISASVGGRVLDSVQIDVTAPIESIEILCSSNPLFVGQQITLDIRALPENTELECEWMSESPEIVSVDSQGNITAHAEGTAIVKAYSQVYSRMAVAELTVKKEAHTGSDDDKPGDTTNVPSEIPESPKDPDNPQKPGEPEKPDNPGASGNGGGSGGGGSSQRAGGTVNIPCIYSGTWEQSGDRWRFILDNGSYAGMCWIYDKGKWYAIGQDGYMLVGWQFIGGEWYYFHPNGSMAVGWIIYDNQKYYLNPLSNGSQGKMVTGWQLIEGRWYYFKEESDGTKGMLLTDIWIEKYYVDRDGVWEEGES